MVLNSRYTDASQFASFPFNTQDENGVIPAEVKSPLRRARVLRTHARTFRFKLTCSKEDYSLTPDTARHLFLLLEPRPPPTRPLPLKNSAGGGVLIVNAPSSIQ